MDGERHHKIHETPVLRGIWLTDGPVRTSLERLLLEMLEPNQPRPDLRRSVLEELSRPVKLTSVTLQYLGLQQVGEDADGAHTLLLVAPKRARNPWEPLLLRPGSDYPLGIVANSRDAGCVGLVHRIFAGFSPPLKRLVRRYVALAAEGTAHERIVETLRDEFDAAGRYDELLLEARRHAQMLAPSVLFGPDSRIRVQLGSLSHTARSLLREGLNGEEVFILPQTLFEGGTNYGDIEFLVYLNFFLRHGAPTRIVGTARQKRTLYRLLTLVLFGLFDPDAAPPSLEQLRNAYGVPDRETYELFRFAFELYAARKTAEPTSALQGLDDYVDFVTLAAGDTIIPVVRRPEGRPAQVAGEVRIRPLASGGFDVLVELTDGRSTAKRMEVATWGRREAIIPVALAQPLQFTTRRPRFGVTPLGTSHGFDPVGDVTSFVIWIDGQGILVDPSPEALTYLARIGVAPVDVPYVLLTHIHADHDGGLLEKLVSWSRTTVIASDVVFRMFLEKAELVTGHDFEREGFVTHVPANPGTPTTIEVGGERAIIETRWNLHTVPTNGFRVTVAGRVFGYAGDTQYAPRLIDRLWAQGSLSRRQHEDLLYFFWNREGAPTVDLLYHEAGIPPIHTERATLEALPQGIRERIHLVHIADKDIPPGARPAKPPLFTTHVLLPATELSRAAVLMSTLRLVSYLHDIPSETLDVLLRAAKVCDYRRNDLILRKGPLGENEPLDFFVVVDGEVSVRHDGRIKTRLQKGDTFGEWGITHQRGYRVADVIASRPTQCLRLSEAQYWWLVERHPVVGDRVARIRGLLPRLEMARDRLRLQGRADARRPTGVMTRMTSGQLARLAMLGETRPLTRNQTVVVEGEDSDGFFVLLSGHLSATVGGWAVGELSEGDTFGELALLEGGQRQATVRVVSADAEVLHVSTLDFQRLLAALPAFSWRVRGIAAGRRDTSHHAINLQPPVHRADS